MKTIKNEDAILSAAAAAAGAVDPDLQAPEIEITFDRDVAPTNLEEEMNINDLTGKTANPFATSKITAEDVSRSGAVATAIASAATSLIIGVTDQINAKDSSVLGTVTTVASALVSGVAGYKIAKEANVAGMGMHGMITGVSSAVVISVVARSGVNLCGKIFGRNKEVYDSVEISDEEAMAIMEQANVAA